MQLFMDILKSLEGDNKIAVEERAFVQELEKSEKLFKGNKNFSKT